MIALPLYRPRYASGALLYLPGRQAATQSGNVQTMDRVYRRSESKLNGSLNNEEEEEDFTTPYWSNTEIPNKNKKTIIIFPHPIQI